MGIIQRLKDKPSIRARASSAVMGTMLIAGIGAAVVTGQASAMDAGTYFMNTTILTYIFAIMAVISLVATIVLEDIRMVALTGVLAAVAFICAYLGL